MADEPYAPPAEPGSDDNLGFIVLIAAVAALGGFLFGFDSGVINGTVDALQTAYGSDDVGTGFSVASVLLGCAVGAFLAGPLADRFGRRPLMLVTAVAFAISAWGSGFAANAAVFVAFRLFGGLAVGAASVLAPAYISEIAPAAYRGRLASLQQMAIVVGLFVAFLSNYSLAQLSGGAAQPWLGGWATWSWMFWVEVLPALAFLLGALMIPESPRFLVAAGRGDEARAVFQRLGPAKAERRQREVEASLGDETRGDWRGLLVPGGVNLRPVVWVGIGLSVFQQLVGINVVFYYGSVLWGAAGFDEGSALLINVITGATNVGVTILAIALIDRLGRRPLLLIGSAGMALTLGGLAVIFAGAAQDEAGKLVLDSATGTAALVLANLYVVAFGLSWGPCVWVLLGEMFPNRIRGTALALGAAAQWLANFAVTMTFPIMLARFGLGSAYGVYAAAAALSFVFVLSLVQETRGRTLEEIGAQA